MEVMLYPGYWRMQRSNFFVLVVAHDTHEKVTGYTEYSTEFNRSLAPKKKVTLVS